MKEQPLLSAIVAGVVVALVVATVALLLGYLEARRPVSWQVVTGTVDEDPSKPFCNDFAVAAQPSEVPLPPTSLIPTRSEQQKWIARVGGIDLGVSRVEIRFQGKGGQAVQLQDPRIVSDSRTPAQTQDMFSYRYGCGGGFTPRYYSLDLDTSVRLQPEPGLQGDKQVPAQPFPLTVSSSDPETIIITARARQADHRWHLEVPWYSEGREGVLKIYAPSDEPFHTLGDVAVKNQYIPTDAGWERSDPAR